MSVMSVMSVTVVVTPCTLGRCCDKPEVLSVEEAAQTLPSRAQCYGQKSVKGPEVSKRSEGYPGVQGRGRVSMPGTEWTARNRVWNRMLRSEVIGKVQKNTLYKMKSIRVAF